MKTCHAGGAQSDGMVRGHLLLAVPPDTWMRSAPSCIKVPKYLPYALFAITGMCNAPPFILKLRFPSIEDSKLTSHPFLVPSYLYTAWNSATGTC